MGKVRNCTNYFIVGGVAASIVFSSEQQVHNHLDAPTWPDSAFDSLTVTAVTTTGVSSGIAFGAGFRW